VTVVTGDCLAGLDACVYNQHQSQLSLPSHRGRKSRTDRSVWLGLWLGAFTCVWWQL